MASRSLTGPVFQSNRTPQIGLGHLTQCKYPGARSTTWFWKISSPSELLELDLQKSTLPKRTTLSHLSLKHWLELVWSMLFDQYINLPDNSASDFRGDSYVSYCQEPINWKFDNLRYYWHIREPKCPDLGKDGIWHAFYSSYVRRMWMYAFRSTKLLITDGRAQMGDDIVEAHECLKSWNNSRHPTLPLSR